MVERLCVHNDKVYKYQNKYIELRYLTTSISMVYGKLCLNHGFT